MFLTLDNYAEILPEEIINSAEKCLVRECDAIERGVYISYVDEGDESFDVSMRVEKDRGVSAHTCDCNNPISFCVHKTALLMHLSNKTYLHDADEVIDLTNEAVKTVVKNKKRIEPEELTLILELWEKVHKPVTDYYQTNMDNEKAFSNFDVLLKSCMEVDFKINSNNGEIQKYVNGLLLNSADNLNNIKEDNSWATAVGFFISSILMDGNKIRLDFINLLNNLFDSSSDNRKKLLVAMVVNHFKDCRPGQLLNGDIYSRMVYRILMATNTFVTHFNLIEPIHLDNPFNLAVIKSLMAIGEQEQARKFCEQQLRQNFRQEYNLQYLNILKEIYLAKNDHPNLARVLAALFPLTFEYADFLFISNRIIDENERRAWQQKMIALAKKGMQDFDPRAAGFYAIISKMH